MKKRRDNEKIFLAVLLCGLFSMPLGLFAQEKTKVTLSRKAVTLNEVITEMKKQTSYDFFYSTELSELKQTFDIDVKDKEVRQVLDEILPPLGLEYAVQQNLIIIREKLDKSASKTMSVKGRVFDSQGASLPGVTVVVKGTTLGTSTDTEGRFELDLPAQDNLRLLFSFIGMETQEVAYSEQEELRVVMREDVKEMEEVVVTGMFDRRAESFTGSAVTVTQEQLRAVGNSNVIQSLRNLDPSFRIAENLEIGSNPNAMPEIQLRGQSGFPDLRGEYATNPNQPLFIVDGFEADLTKVIDMDMNRIASVTLLKDAAAKAIYGSKAANGVVVIETKRPEPGELRVTYTGTVTVNLPDMSSYELCNSTEKLQVELNAGLYDYIGYNGVVYWEDPNRQYIYSERYNDLLKETLRGVNTDWKAQPLRNAVGHKHVVYLEGGDEAFQYGIDFSFNNVVGVMKGSGRKTFSGGLTFSYRYKNLLLRDQLEVVYNRGDNSPWGDFSEYTSMNPYFRPYDENGNLIKTYTLYEGSTETNPMWNAMIKTKDMTEYSQFTNNFYAEWRAFEGFKASARIGLTRTDNGAEIFLPATHTDFATYTTDELLNRRGSYTYTDGYSFQLSADVNASYSKYFGNHLLMANAGWTLNDQTTKSMTMKAEGFPNDRLDDIGYARSYAEDSAPTSTESTVRDIGVVAAVNYSYADRYLFEVNFRYDGSSRFAKNNRWGFFPSFSAGWRIDQESFMEDARDWLSNLKLRASWGKLGNQSIGLYQYTPTLVSGVNYLFDNTLTQGYAVAQAVDSEISWETTTITNVALDFGFLNNSLSGSVEFFKKRTDGILRTVNQPSQVGNYTGAVRNVGVVDNTGMEASLSYRNSIGGFNYNVYGNMTYVKNEVVKLGGDEIINGRRITKEGYPIDSYYVYDCIGIFQTQEEVDNNHAFQSAQTAPGDLKFRDVSGNGVIDEDDRIVTGSSVPDFTYSFGLNLNYKGFGLNVFFQGVHGITTYPMHNLVQPYCNGAGVTYDWLEKAWRPDNTDGGYPRLLRSQTGHDNYEKANTFWLRDASYLRLKNVQLSYDFPKKWLKPIRINALKVFVNAENLLTFSDFDIFDPERTLTGNYLWGTYPSVKSFTGGLNVTF